MTPEQLRAMVPADADLSYISPDLRPLAVPVSALIPDSTNPKKHGPRNQQVIQHCMAEFSQREVLVANIRSGQPVLEVGHGRLMVAIEKLGWQYIAVNLVDDDPITHTRYLLASNQAALVTEDDDPDVYDRNALAALLMGLEAEGDDVEDIGFTPAAVKELLESVSGDGEGDGEVEGKEYDEDIENEVEFITCPQCAHKWPK